MSTAEGVPVPRVLGVSCSGPDGYLTVIDVDDATGHLEVVAVGSGKISPVPAGDRGEALVLTLDEWRRALTLIAPDAVALLLPESEGTTKKVHAFWAPRCEAETLAGLSAGVAGVPFDRLSRATVRARLSLGKLDAAAKLEPAHGMYWSHRALGLYAARALAVVAAERGWPARLARSDHVLGEVADAAAG